jgi:peptidoglycan/xylan/chitin deacetylase (PgdA/CDA1 family)
MRSLQTTAIKKPKARRLVAAICCVARRNQLMKKLAKAAFYSLYKYTGLMRLHEAIRSAVGRSFASILLFHRVTDEIPPDGITVSTAWFRQICRMLRDRFRAVPLGEIARLVQNRARIPRRTVAITFDDCYRDNLLAARVLAEHGLPACFFVPARYVETDHVFPWDRDHKPLANLTWDEVREIAGMGFEIGSHTLTHPNLGELSLDQARVEMVESKAVIEKELGLPVRWFAYPFGGPQHFRTEQLALLAEAGYEGCLSAISGFIYRGRSYPILPREGVPPFENNLNLEMHLSGCLNWVYGLKRLLGLQDKPPMSGQASEAVPVSLPKARETAGPVRV